MGEADEQSASAAIQQAGELAVNQPDEALELLNSAVPPRLRRRAPSISARACYLRARLLAERGEYDSALGAIRAARRDWLAAGEVMEALSTDLGKATVLHELGEYRTAIEVSEALLDSIGRMPLEPHQFTAASSMRARAHNNLGNSWGRLGDHHAALHHYDIASNLFRALDMPGMQSETDANRGVAYLKLGMAHRALDELARAESALRRLDRQRAAAKCRVDIADAHLHLDQVDAAIDVLTGTRLVLEDLHAVPELARLGLVLSNALLRAGLPADAHREALEAADAFADMSMADETARATYLCGSASLQLNDLAEAAREFAGAERLFADCGDASYEGRTWLAQADLARRTGDLKPARKLASRAARRLEERDEAAPAAYAQILLAEVAEEGADASAHLARAEQLVATMDLASLQLALELAHARNLRRSGRLDDAAQRLRTALARSLFAPEDSTADVELRIVLYAAGTDAADELIDILLEQGTHQAVTEAWQRASGARTRALDEYVARARARSRLGALPDVDGGGPSWEVADLSRMYDQIYAEMAVSGVGPDPLVARRVRGLERRLLEEAARDHDPAPAELVASGPRPEAAGPLPVPEGPVLQYQVLRNDVVAFVIREGQVRARRLRGAADASRRVVRAWQAECSRLATAAHAVADIHDAGAGEPVQALAQLHQLLVEPVADLLDDLDGQPLLVIPHRHLLSVPFEALTDDGVPLAERFSLAFCIGLSADSFAQRTEMSKAVPGSTLVLAVPDDRAPGIGAEAEMIAALRPDTELFMGAHATTRTLAQRAAGKEIVHIACHATYRPSSPLFSGLMLADRWMTAAEIVDVDLTDTLVVLSACAAGRGSETLGEPAGLAWAFVAGGCRAVVACRWVVDDEVATEFMNAFYSHLEAGLFLREALDQARSDVARTHPHPYHWAAFQYLCSPTTALTEGLSL